MLALERLPTVAVVAILTLALLAACGGDDDDEPAATRVSAVVGAPTTTTPPAASPTGSAPTGARARLEAVDIAWNQATLTVPAGGTIDLVNLGDIEHNFAIDGYAPLEDEPVDLPTDGTVVPYALPGDLGPGSYTYYCAVPGHRALMSGTLTVR